MSTLPIASITVNRPIARMVRPMPAAVRVAGCAGVERCVGAASDRAVILASDQELQGVADDEASTAAPSPIAMVSLPERHQLTGDQRLLVEPIRKNTSAVMTTEM